MECVPDQVYPPWSSRSAYTNMPECTVDRDCSIITIEVPGSTVQYYKAVNELTGQPGGCIMLKNQAVCTNVLHNYNFRMH